MKILLNTVGRKILLKTKQYFIYHIIDSNNNNTTLTETSQVLRSNGIVISRELGKQFERDIYCMFYNNILI